MKKGYKKKLSKKKIAKRNKLILRHSLISFALLCLFLVSFFTYSSYSLWNQTYSQTSNNEVSSGCFDLEINDLDENNMSTAINLKNTYPMTELKGLTTSPYIIEIKNICNIPSEYTIVLNKFSNSNLTNDLIRYQIKKVDESNPTKLLSQAQLYQLDTSLKSEVELNQGITISQSYNLAEGYLNANETVSYELRIWLDYEATNDAMNKNFEAGMIIISTPPQ